MADGAGGVLVDDVEACARDIVELLGDPSRSEDLAITGRERVRQRFLLPRLLLDELSLIADLLQVRPLPARPPAAAATRDPVCGMALPENQPALTAEHDGSTYQFCSEACRARFLASPGQYAGGGRPRSRTGQDVLAGTDGHASAD